jgi:hypothetical protein
MFGDNGDSAAIPTVSAGVSSSHSLLRSAILWRGVLLLVSAVARQGGAILGLCGIVFIWGGVLLSARQRSRSHCD